MAIQLEDLVARLRLDTSGVATGLGGLNSSLSSVGAKATSTGKSMSLGLTAPIVGIGVASANLAAGFDKTMRMVAIATGGPSKALSDLAMKMGAETAFSAGEAADAMLELAKGGMTAAQIEGGALAATMKLASAGGIGLAESSTYVSNAMAMFGLRAKDADKVTVALAGAANASSASVESLGMGLSQVGGIASSAGMSLQETVGALSAFDAQGLKGSDAGTSLKSMLNNLIPTTEKASKAMDSLGLDFVKGNGEFESMSSIAGQLREKLGGLSDSQRNLALETIFGSDGMRAANAAMNAGEKGMRGYIAAARDQETTTKLANAAMEGVSGAVERAKGSIETAMLTIGQVLAPYVERAAGFVELLANKFTALPGPVKGVAVAVAAIAAALGPLLIVFGVMASSIGALAGLFATAAPAAAAAGTAVSGVGVAAGAAISPLLLIVGAAAAVGAGLYLLYTRSETARAVMQQGAAQISAAFAGLRAVVMPIIQQIVGVFVSQMPQIRATVASVFGSVKTIIASAMSIVRSIIVAATAVIRTVWNVLGSTILSTISRVMSSVMQVIRGAFNIIAGIFRTVSAVLRGDWSAAWDGIKQIVSGAGQVIAGVVRGLFAVVRGIFSGAIAVIVSLARAIWADVTATFRSGVDTAIGAVRGLPDKIKGVFANAGTLLLSIGGDIVDGLVNGIQNAAGAVYDAAMSLVEKIPGPIRKVMGIASPSKVMHEIGEQIVQGLALGMTDTLPQITVVRDELAKSLDSMGKLIESKLDKVWNGKKLDKYVAQVKGSLKNEIGAVRGAAKTYDSLIAKYNATREAGTKAYDAIVERLKDAQDNLRQLQEQQADYAASIQNAVVDFGSVVGLGSREDSTGARIAATAQSIIEDLRARTLQAADFAARIAQLTAAGLNQTSLRQLLAAGVEGGLSTAAAIADGGAGAVAEINALTAQLAATGASMGASTASLFFQQGVDAAAAVADGIAAEAVRSQQATAAMLAGIAVEIDTAEGNMRAKMRKLGRAATDGLAEGMTEGDKLKKTAEAVAKAIKDEVKKALGIRSPSRVMAELGKMTGLGFAQGMLSTTGAIASASGSMADAALVTAPTYAAAAAATARRASSASTATPVLHARVFIGDRELTDIVRVEIGDGLAPLRSMSRQGAI